METVFWPLVILVALWIHISLALIIGQAAKARGQSRALFIFLALFLSALIAILLLLVLPNTPPQPSIEGPDGLAIPAVFECPFCGEEIRSNATACRFCTRDVGEIFEQRIAQLAVEHAARREQRELAATQAASAAAAKAEARKLAQNKFWSGPLGKLAIVASGVVAIVTIVGIFAIAPTISQTISKGELCETVSSARLVGLPSDALSAADRPWTIDRSLALNEIGQEMYQNAGTLNRLALSADENLGRSDVAHLFNAKESYNDLGLMLTTLYGAHGAINFTNDDLYSAYKIAQDELDSFTAYCEIDSKIVIG